MIIEDLPYLMEVDQEKITGGHWYECISIFADFNISKILEQYSDVFDVSIALHEKVFNLADNQKQEKAVKASPKTDKETKTGSGFKQSTSSSTDQFPK